MSYDIPILFLIFNRPETTNKVFDKIRQIKPKKLYIAADGPRKNNNIDIVNCLKVKEIIRKIDWNCEVKTLYRKKNLGCKVAVSSAINWFFENEEMGVILEDDCLPNDSFFKYCKKLLIKYQNNEKIMIISGISFISNKIRQKYVDSDYFFSKYIGIWGWATWRRAWKLYDVSISTYPIKKSYVLNNNSNCLLDKLYWGRIFNLVYKNKIDTWDYQWQYCIWLNDGLSINPRYNLVKNIGFGISSTHTKNNIKQEIRSLNIKKHPIKYLTNKDVDNYYSKRYCKKLLYGLFLKSIKFWQKFLKIS